MNHSKVLSLYDLSQKIQDSLNVSFPENLWVVGEISDLNENRSGHCYLELVEKDSIKESPKAKARATIWAASYRMLNPFFETSTKRKFSAGLKILVLCNVNYHPVYGLSLNILDIDPTFTIGDIEQQKQQTINQLIDDGVFDMNKEVEFPILPKRVAVISSATAAGYQDFIHQLNYNSHGYAVTYKLFSAVMQGDKAEESILDAISQVFEEISNWDLLVIIRGGGSQVDLSCFDGYTLASYIAQFPLPVITGIGHEKDISVADMVAHTRAKTPTAAAEIILRQFESAENLVLMASESFRSAINGILTINDQYLSRIKNSITPVVLNSTKTEAIKINRIFHRTSDSLNRLLTKKKFGIKNLLQNLSFKTTIYIDQQKRYSESLIKQIKTLPLNYISTEYDKAMMYERTINTLNPDNILRRGYSITLRNGKIFKNIDTIKVGDKIETIISDGRILSEVTQSNKGSY